MRFQNSGHVSFSVELTFVGMRLKALMPKPTEYNAQEYNEHK